MIEVVTSELKGNEVALVGLVLSKQNDVRRELGEILEQERA